MIDSPAGLTTLLDKMRGEPAIGFDCEFHGEGRYFPELCLVQVAYGDEVEAIDPFAVDLTPMGDMLADASVQKVFHAALNDIPLLVAATGQPVENVFDTQIAAAFVGHGATPAYSRLVESVCRTRLSKKSRFTDWKTRPLTTHQIDYALDDVRHLLPLASQLGSELERRGRMEWARMATDEINRKAHSPRDRSRLYIKLARSGRFSRKQLAILREVADWRDRRAEAIDRPPQRVAPDEALKQLAVDPPRSVEDLRRVRGMDRIGSSADDLFAAITRAVELPPDEYPEALEQHSADERTEVTAQLLATALRIHANELDIAPAMVASRHHLDHLVAWHYSGRRGSVPEIVSEGTWKHSAVGEMLLSILDGRYALGLDADSRTGVTLWPATRPDDVPA